MKFMRTLKNLLSSQKLVLALAIAIMFCGVVAVGSASASTDVGGAYPVGTLLRSVDGKIYVVKSVKTIQHILDLKELAKYHGQKIVNVDAGVIMRYQEVFYEIAYQNGSLLRSPDHKIYVLVSGKKKYISSLTELAYNYSGRIIYNVTYATIAKY
jgi:hypothetical protein